MTDTERELLRQTFYHMERQLMVMTRTIEQLANMLEQVRDELSPERNGWIEYRLEGIPHLRRFPLYPPNERQIQEELPSLRRFLPGSYRWMFDLPSDGIYFEMQRLQQVREFCDILAGKEPQP